MGGFLDQVNNLFGGSPLGSGFQAPGVNGEQLRQSYDMTRSGLTQQQDLINALQAQNGIGNQSDIFTQLQQIAQGEGPNPAQQMLNQATGQNVAGQAALQAGQRGGSQNVGLIARQAGQQGGQLQQQAAGQGSLMQALQSLQALGMAGNIAGQQVGNQMGAIGGFNQMAQGNQGQLLNYQGNTNATNQRMAEGNASRTAQAFGGLSKASSGFLGQQSLGNENLQKGFTAASATMSEGGKVENPKLKTVASGDRFSGNLYPSHLKPVHDIYHGNNYESGGRIAGTAEVPGDSERNDTVPIMASPGEFVVTRSVMQSTDPIIRGALKVIQEHQKAAPRMHDGGKVLPPSQGKDQKTQGSYEGDFKKALRAAIEGRKNRGAKTV
jgi:hypothetical protein